MSQAAGRKRKTKGTMGGWRPGAGSKPTIGITAARPVTIYFSEEQLAAIDNAGRINGMNRSEVVRHYVSRSLLPSDQVRDEL